MNTLAKSLEHRNVTIHPTAIIGDKVQLDDGVVVGPYCFITGNVVIESGTRLHANVIIGPPAQNLTTKDSLGIIHIKKNCEIREFVTIHASKYPDGATIVGNNCYIMNFCHVAHDCILEDGVTLINGTQLGGHVQVGKNAIFMANSAAHQFCSIGQYSAVAPYSGTRQDLPPFCLFNGQPAAFAGLNSIGLKRAGFSTDDINALRSLTRRFYQHKVDLAVIREEVEQGVIPNTLFVQMFLDFVSISKRGISRRCIGDTAVSSEHRYEEVNQL